jgi:hypothetical protein
MGRDAVGIPDERSTKLVPSVFDSGDGHDGALLEMLTASNGVDANLDNRAARDKFVSLNNAPNAMVKQMKSHLNQKERGSCRLCKRRDRRMNYFPARRFGPVP